MEKKLILKSDVLDALEKAGVKPGQVIMVHTSLDSIGYVCGGAQTIIEALTEAVGCVLTDNQLLYMVQIQRCVSCVINSIVFCCLLMLYYIIICNMCILFNEIIIHQY